MTAKSFVDEDEDWTGLTNEDIYRQIVAELEEQQYKGNGHKIAVAIFCRRCGEQIVDFNLGCD